MNNTKIFLLGILLLIIIGYLLHSSKKRLLLADPGVVLAISTAKTEAQPLIDALKEFHRLHGSIPARSENYPKTVFGVVFI